jgi:Ku70/Ku80 beta-barrel domain
VPRRSLHLHIINRAGLIRQINKKTGNRLRQQLVDEVTREPVDGADKGRGCEYAKNAYIPVDDDELDAVAIESNHTIEIDSFVPREQIDERYLDSPYYITPNDPVGLEAFALIREAMRRDGMAALGRDRGGGKEERPRSSPGAAVARSPAARPGGAAPLARARPPDKDGERGH